MRRALLLVPLLFACGTSGGSATDGGLADQGLSDAAMPSDAGLPDAAGPSDAEVPDVGAPDASAPDAAAPDAGPPDAGTLGRHEVLFIGNSYTYGNDLPALYRDLVASLKPAPDPLNVDSVTAGGRRLTQHAAEAADASQRLGTLLSATGPQWTQVILQEQSQIPGFAPGQPDYDASLAAATDFGARIGSRGGALVFFMTWGRRAGDSSNSARFGDFSAMQGHLETGYRALAAAAQAAGANASIAPVGLAFAEVHAEDAAAGDPLEPSSLFYRLYAPDGSHPSLLGSYLAACVFAATTLQVDATDIEFTPAGITETDALRLRAAAQRVVLAERNSG